MKVDPKPRLGKAAIQAAIEYYDARAAHAHKDLNAALASKAQWQQELNAVHKIVDSGSLKMSPPGIK